MNLIPLQDRLIIQRIMPEQPTSSGGILLPPTEETQDTPFSGLVVAVGPGKACTLQPAGEALVNALEALIGACRILAEAGHGMSHQSAPRSIDDAQDALDRHNKTVVRIPMSVKIGDVVLYSRHGHQSFRLEGAEFVTFGEDSVIGVMSE